MKHTKLDLNDLAVDSFETLSDSPALRGTVRGHDPSLTCPGEDGCAVSAYGCGPNTHYFQNTCGDQMTCHNHSCQMTGSLCNCNYTDGVCTMGVQDTCERANPPCIG
jgi:hypothetical protein